MIFKQLFDSKTWTYTYLLGDADSHEAIIIDPVLEQVDRDIKLIEELGLNLKYTLDTHAHADHITGSGLLRERCEAQSVVSAHSGVDCANFQAADGETLQFGKFTLEILATPGHTLGCQSFVLRTEDRTLVFTGDALLIRGCGRTDFQQGDPHILFHSVHDKFFTLPDNSIIYPGHDYKGHTSSTIAEEKQHNPRLNLEVSEDAFVDIMNNLNIAKPKLIDITVPANLACGRTP